MFQKIDSACFAKTDIWLLVMCAQALLTSSKNTTSSSWLTGSETMRRTNSSSILVTDSNTTPSGITKPSIKDGWTEREDSPLCGETEREDRPLSGEAEREKVAWGQFKRSERGDDKLAIDGVGDENGEKGLLDRISERDAKTSKPGGMSMSDKFSSSSTGESGPNSGSFITSQISLNAKLSGPIGMTIGLAPAPLTEVIGTAKDRLNSMEPDRSKVTKSAIPSDSLEKKIKNIEKQESAELSGKKNCSTSLNPFAKHILN